MKNRSTKHREEMKQQRSWCLFLNHKLLPVLMSVVVLAVMLIGFLTVPVNMGGRVDVMPPPAPTSSGSPHSASILPDND
ncbi:hypothetical protein SETIT_5G077800v2 [Setaria italica]|uniref:Uncharacterized protein n=2 Tax=Setaria TaxID=4554 RepID=A0A368R2R7_SETIT|nr:hypothetical protein SETIT_5G077800v2 [Setaria italica]TKW13068.1 hypothetical protein SEVIR_5G076400v2 [Setaria viridis]TKW13069.1 hypothetical protein SEVIR_5G076400v2 [Setaria viridis]